MGTGVQIVYAPVSCEIIVVEFWTDGSLANKLCALSAATGERYFQRRQHCYFMDTLNM